MIVYFNNQNLINNIIHNIEYDESREEKYIFSPNGTYKKYKHHT